MNAPRSAGGESTLGHLVSSALYTVLSVALLGICYPLVVWGIGSVVFPHQAGGSPIESQGTLVGSELVGQNFTKPGYFHGRLSAAGKGYDPTSTGGTNYGPTSKKLLDATRAAVTAIRKENPDATGPVPAELVTSSASGIDPDISPEAAYFQAARVAKARGIALQRVRDAIAAHVRPRELGFLGEPRVNVVELNRALDAPAP